MPKREVADRERSVRVSDEEVGGGGSAGDAHEEGEEVVIEVDRVICADVLEGLAGLPDGSVQMCVTSPPYWRQRAYEGDQVRVWPKIPSWNCAHRWGDDVPGDPRGGSGTQTNKHGRGECYSRGEPCGAFCRRCGAWRGALGQEPTFELFVEHIVLIFREVRRVLRPDGCLFLNMGDAYASGWSCNRRDVIGQGSADMSERSSRLSGGLKEKDLIGMPWAVAFALRDDGWWLRRDHIWWKPNPMPESPDDRCTTAHEYMFHLTKRARYVFDSNAIKEMGTSGPSDVKKMAEQRARIGGAHKEADDVLMRASRHTNIGRMRGVGSPMRTRRSVWEIEPAEDEDTCPCCGSWTTGNVWKLSTSQASYEFCLGCKRYYTKREANRISKRIEAGPDGRDKIIKTCSCGREDGWLAHFATMPTELVRPCIRAGSSEAGACAECAAPRKRVVEVEYVKSPVHGEGSVVGRHEASGQNNFDGAGMPRLNKEVTTTGFEPTCDCDTEETKPCLVLDPFFGSGTTGIVSVEEGRSYIGIDVSEEYCQLAEARIARVSAQGRLDF